MFVPRWEMNILEIMKILTTKNKYVTHNNNIYFTYLTVIIRPTLPKYTR